MSQKILKALMQLFAIIANPQKGQTSRRPFVEFFLKEQLNKELVEEYLKVFDKYYSQYQKRQSKSKNIKVISVSSVKLLTICTLLNEELTQKQKTIVLIRLLEFIKKDGIIYHQEYEFVSSVADTFNIPKYEFKELKNFVFRKEFHLIDPSRLLIINSEKNNEKNNKSIYSENLIGEIKIIHIQSANIHIFYFQGEKELYLNQQLLNPEKTHILSHGSAIRNSKIKPIYYSDIISTFNYDIIKSKIVFEADRLKYKFKNGTIGIQEFNLVEKSGKLVGIMGASGSGKTTLLNVLNGSLKPSFGNLLINGIDLHKNPKELEGLIGYVSQDDLLIEDLTVYENLYFNAKLCFGNYNRFKINRVVLKTLINLGLYEIKDMKVGSPLNKKISGGQRKRLNIALELIRESPILFLDEPTSGLSSGDSEKIMDLLKELTLRGKLVFVVIHQPSSAIFKMFDRLLVLDQGGFLIYNGQPVESLIYFKSSVRKANWTDSECQVCGSVHVEQIFNIVESKIIDEYGNLTQTRKIYPLEWKEKFLEYQELSGKKKRSFLVRELPKLDFQVPNWFKQCRTFIVRDVLSKLNNYQYILINFFEAPVLALLLSFIIRYYNLNNEMGYTFFHNDNIPVYIFMSVIIALFVGLTVSAQEIIKDRKILKRESFLNLSKSSYLTSKILILFTLSAFQSFTFVLIGNSILEVKGMFFEYWLVLFSTWSAANLLGLNISDGFKTSITIYILIPFLIIPQIILSGVLVKYDKLNPAISSPSKIPFYGEIIIARWAYEALAVNQFVNNEYNKDFYPYEKKEKNCHYMWAVWYTSINNALSTVNKNIKISAKKEETKYKLKLIRNELKRKSFILQDLKPKIFIDNLYYDKITQADIDSLYIVLEKIYSKYNRIDKNVGDLKDKLIVKTKEKIGADNFNKKMLKYHNKQLSNFVENTDIDMNIEYKARLYRKSGPIYNEPEYWFLKSHFYAPVKNIFGKPFDTFWVNIIVIWFQIVLLYITLYYSLLKRFLNFVAVINRTRKRKKEEEDINKIKIIRNRSKIRKKRIRRLTRFFRI